MWSFRSNAEPRRWWWKGGKLPPKWDRSQPAGWKWQRWRRQRSDCLTLQRGLRCVSAEVLFPYLVAILETGHWTLMQFGCLARCCAAALTVLTVGCIKYCSSVIWLKWNQQFGLSWQDPFLKKCVLLLCKFTFCKTTHSARLAPLVGRFMFDIFSLTVLNV